MTGACRRASSPLRRPRELPAYTWWPSTWIANNPRRCCRRSASISCRDIAPARPPRSRKSPRNSMNGGSSIRCSARSPPTNCRSALPPPVDCGRGRYQRSDCRHQLKDVPSANGARTPRARSWPVAGTRAARRVRRAEPARVGFVDWHASRWFAAALIVLLLSMADTMLTLVLVQHGAIEINPLMEPFVIGNGPAFAYLKLALTASAVMILVVLTRVPTFGRLLAGPDTGRCGVALHGAAHLRAVAAGPTGRLRTGRFEPPGHACSNSGAGNCPAYRILTAASSYSAEPLVPSAALTDGTRFEPVRG